MKKSKKALYILGICLISLLIGYVSFSFIRFTSKRNIKLNDVVGVTYRSKNRENYFFFDSEDYVVFYVKETYYRSIDISYNNGIAILTDENDKTIKLAFLDSDHTYSSTFNMYFYNENLLKK